MKRPSVHIARPQNTCSPSSTKTGSRIRPVSRVARKAHAKSARGSRADATARFDVSGQPAANGALT
jgi:hypothetical protein